MYYVHDSLTLRYKITPDGFTCSLSQSNLSFEEKVVVSDSYARIY